MQFVRQVSNECVDSPACTSNIASASEIACASQIACASHIARTCIPVRGSSTTYMEKFTCAT